MGLNSNIRLINSTTCHCCSFDVFGSIIKDKSLRLCDMKNTNDPEEVKAAGRYIISLINDFYKMKNDDSYMLLKEKFMKELPLFNPYVASFTNFVNETIFERYAKDGQGVGINFSSSKFGIGLYLVNDHKDIYYVPVFYNPQECQKYATIIISKFINKKIDVNSACLELLKLSCMFKTRKWREEQEIRIFYVPSEKKLLGEKHYFEKGNIKRSYYNLTFDKFNNDNVIEEIILGPKFRLENVDKVNNILSENGYKNVKVLNFEEAYDISLRKKEILKY